MHAPLQLHPASLCEAVDTIKVELAPTATGFLVRYRATGTIADLRLPPPSDPHRADNLWQHTCFEAFARREEEAAYHELNFSPSTQWAAYCFDDYRAGMREAEMASPRIETRARGNTYELDATVELPSGAWRLSLSAVIEETNGRKSYWALAHPPGKADFHHPDSFILELPPHP